MKLQGICLFWKHHKLLSRLVNEYKLDLLSIHGKGHWARVRKAGDFLCSYENADYEVVFLFAYLHDIKRINEGDDPEHGQRVGVFIEKLYQENQIRILKNQLEVLVFACLHHSNSNIESSNITVQTCWDADRLDLWRIGIKPDKNMLNTILGRSKEAINLLQ